MSSLRAVRYVADSVHPEGCELTLIRKGTNDVYCSDKGSVFRVCPDSKFDVNRYSSTITFAGSVENVPVVRPLLSGLVSVYGYTVSVWEYADGVEPVDKSATGYREVGALARALHDVRPYDVLPYPVASPVAKVEGSLQVLERIGTSAGVVSDLRGVLREVEPFLPYIFPQSVEGASGICHSDLHVGNVVYHAGEPLLIDLDGIGFGESRYDFVPAVVNSEVRCEPEILADFESGYGSSVFEWSYLELACKVKKLTMTTWVGTVQPGSEPHRVEFEKRVEALLSGAVSEPWLNL